MPYLEHLLTLLRSSSKLVCNLLQPTRNPKAAMVFSPSSHGFTLGVLPGLCKESDASLGSLKLHLTLLGGYTCHLRFLLLLMKFHFFLRHSTHKLKHKSWASVSTLIKSSRAALYSDFTDIWLLLFASPGTPPEVGDWGHHVERQVVSTKQKVLQALSLPLFPKYNFLL